MKKIVSKIRFNFIKGIIKSSINSIIIDEDYVIDAHEGYFVGKTNNEYTIGLTSEKKEAFESIDFKNNEKKLVEYTKKYFTEELERIGELLLATDKIAVRYDIERTFSDEERKEWEK